MTVGVLKPSGLPAVGCCAGEYCVVGDAGFPDAEPSVAVGQLHELHAKAVGEKSALVDFVKTGLGRRVAAATGEQANRRK